MSQLRAYDALIARRSSYATKLEVCGSAPGRVPVLGGGDRINTVEIGHGRRVRLIDRHTEYAFKRRANLMGSMVLGVTLFPDASFSDGLVSATLKESAGDLDVSPRDR